MKFTDEQRQDIQSTCKKVCEGSMSIEEGNKYLEKYGLKEATYSKDGKAILTFSDGETLRFGALLYKAGYYNPEEDNRKHR